MTKEEAIHQMRKGNKLTHYHFRDEWVKSDPSGSIFMFEDGVQCPSQEFWKWRTDESWDIDWEFF